MEHLLSAVPRAKRRTGAMASRIDVSDPVRSTETLKALFALDRSSFIIDVEELNRQYSIESCLAKFNDMVVSVCE